MYVGNNIERKVKNKMESKLYSKEKLRQKNIKISVKVEILKEKINKIFDDNEADDYIKRKTINSMKKDLIER